MFEVLSYCKDFTPDCDSPLPYAPFLSGAAQRRPSSNVQVVNNVRYVSDINVKKATRSTLNVALFTVTNPVSLNFSRLFESQTREKGVVSLGSLNSRRRLNSRRKSALLDKKTITLFDLFCTMN